MLLAGANAANMSEKALKFFIFFDFLPYLS